MKCRAAVATKPWTIEFQEVNAPEPGPEDVVVELTHSWISNGTEGSFIRGERIAGDTAWREGDPSPFPHVPGYQKVGVVTHCGPDVTHVKVGDKVFVSISWVSDLFESYGGHVSPSVAHRSQVWKLPDGLDPLAASGLVLTQVGWNLGIRPELRPGDACVVIGDGMVGHWAAQTLRGRGARVMLLGRRPERLKLFKPQTGDMVVNARETDSLAAVSAWAPEGVQVIGHSSGSTAFLESLYPSLKRLAHLVSASFVGTEGLMDVQRMRDKELTLHAISGWTSERIDQTLAWLAEGRLDTLSLITHHFKAEDCAQAYDLILHNRAPHLGVVLDW